MNKKEKVKKNLPTIEKNPAIVLPVLRLSDQGKHETSTVKSKISKVAAADSEPLIHRFLPEDQISGLKNDWNAPHFTYKYNGLTDLPIESVIESLINIKKGLEQISTIEGGPPCRVELRPFKQGSFELLIGVLDPVTVAQLAMVAKAIPGQNVIEKFKSIAKLVSFLKGDKAKSTKPAGKNNYKIQNESGEVITVDAETANVYSGGTTINYGPVYHIQNLFLDAAKVENVEGIELLDDKGRTFLKVPKKRLHETANNITKARGQIKVEKVKSKKELRKDAKVRIIKPDLAGDTLWKVVYDGRPINLRVEDRKFHEDVNKGIHRFANGDVLIIDLEITRDYQKDLKVYLDKSYALSKFHEIIPVNPQGDLFEE